MSVGETDSGKDSLAEKAALLRTQPPGGSRGASGLTWPQLHRPLGRLKTEMGSDRVTLDLALGLTGLAGPLWKWGSLSALWRERSGGRYSSEGQC